MTKQHTLLGSKNQPSLRRLVRLSQPRSKFWSKSSSTALYVFPDVDDDTEKSEAEMEEEVRLQILESRRYQIRSVLKSAESIRNLRLQKGWIPKLDPETGKPVTFDSNAYSKVTVSLTAFIVAAGAIALRIGGRAALISAVGLDFAQDNPELKENLEQVLAVAETMDPATKLFLFTMGWTAVKVFCFDAGGIVLALASGILFGGVVQGAALSAAAATFGSSVAFGLAKLDTPIRKKSLEILEQYPSLRGIEKVVAQDGVKAILTLRLAPILPIPIGLYNYIYGVTNVPLSDFACGIYLGSLKPYLLDSYLGYFGKEVIEGSSSSEAAAFQDILLLVALGLSVLIGVFASQLAAETWDTVLAEVEAEKKAKKNLNDDDKEEIEDSIAKEFLGWTLPGWTVDWQRSYKNAERVVNDMILAEYEAKVWNFTKAEDGGPPPSRDPALLAGSPELEEKGKRFDFGESVLVGIALSPSLFSAWTKFSDPLYNEENDDELQKRRRSLARLLSKEIDDKKQEILLRLDALKAKADARLALVEEILRREQQKSNNATYS